MNIIENTLKHEIKTFSLNTTYLHTIEDYCFGNIPKHILINTFKDGRAFAHFIEPWLEINYPIIHITGCKTYDHIDAHNMDIKYEQKTFTKRGCKFMPSNMIGEGRKFNQEIFEQKAKQLIYIIISNIYFPEIKIKFITGVDLLITYPNGIIPLKDFHKFFN